MALPGFTAEAAVYVSSGHYMASVGGPVMSGIVPALPSCSACNTVCDQCFDCLDSGKPMSKCPACRVCNHCGSCSTHTGPGPGLFPCDFLQNPIPGVNCQF